MNSNNNSKYDSNNHQNKSNYQSNNNPSYGSSPTKTREIEILAPAGSYEGMRAAMNAGCDAVYIGGRSFGARAYANNLEDDVLLQAIDEAHIRGKKLYLTVNTLLKEKELAGELYDFLEKFYRQGLDAVIVQDVGVLHFIHRNFPELPIHASTQTTLTMAEGANLLKDYGVTRLVTARELSLSEIKNIRNHTDLEIETFVHGALCYCYSGQCLMSSIIGGRSGNRGKCAQPCRMPYQFYSEGDKLSSDKEKYLLSPKDINTLALIPELIEAGIDSFKIEGRMKKPEYAAAVAHTYRKYVDLYQELGKERYHKHLQSEEFRKDMTMLQDIYNRGGFSQGYGKTYNGKVMMCLNRPNHTGVYVGEVVSTKAGQVSITLKEDVNAQDVLEIFPDEEGGHEFTVKDHHRKGALLTTNAGKNGQKIKVGAAVYRTRNNVLMEQLTKEYLTQDKRRGFNGYLYAKVGEKLSLTVSCGSCTITACHQEVQEAQKQPMTKEKLAAPLEKTGDTLFYFESLIIDSGDNIFVPVAWLNEIRREGLRLISETLVNQYRRERPNTYSNTFSNSLRKEAADSKDISYNAPSKREALDQDKINAEQPGIVVSVQTKEQFETAIGFSGVEAIYCEYDTMEQGLHGQLAMEATAAGKKFYLVLPTICRQEHFQGLKKDLEGIIVRKEIEGFIAKNFEEIALLQSLMKETGVTKEIILNYNMYTYNREARLFWEEQGITRLTAPVELNYQELMNLGLENSDLLVYGYLPLMTSAQCLYKSTVGCRKCKDGRHKGHMIDRLGKKFYVQANCNGCYNTIYNGQALSLVKYKSEIRKLMPRKLRLDFTLENSDEMNRIFRIYLDVFYRNKKEQTELTGYTTGHFKRGIE